MKCIFGSYLYGTNTENSDRDYKGIYIPEKNDCYLNLIKNSVNATTSNDSVKNTNQDIDEEIYSIQYFMKLAQNGEMIVLDMLHAPDDMLLINTPIFQKLRKNKSKFYSKNLSGYLDYIRKQTAKYSIKGERLLAMEDVLKVLRKGMLSSVTEPRLNLIWDQLPVNEFCRFIDNPKEPRRKHYECCGKMLQDTMAISYAYNVVKSMYDSYGERAKKARDNNGIDWKACSHCLRACFQLKEIYQTGNLIFPLKDAEYLKDIKLGKLHFIDDKIGEKMESLLDEVQYLSSISNYPDIVDKKFLDEFILNCYK